MAGETKRTTHDHPFIIPNPSLAFVNLQGAAGKPLMEQDHAALADLFQNTQIAERTLPKCNVLFLYGALDASGRLPGTQASFRDLIGAVGAHVAVLASELQPELLSDSQFTASLSAKHAWTANIVLTLNRNGDHFGSFFRQLFSLMRSGISMPMAWVELAPQGPQQRKDIPGSICLMQAGHIAFSPKPSGHPPELRVKPADRF